MLASSSACRTLYSICLAGAPNANQISDVRTALELALAHQGKAIGSEVEWLVDPASYLPPDRVAAAVLFFAGSNPSVSTFSNALRKGVPCIPIVPQISSASTALPPELVSLNAIGYSDAGPSRVASATLEVLGLLPKQRRVFVSYRRSESRDAAVQLFDALSGRLFDVFLDTHGVAPGDDFQEVLWHRLCDCDLLVMLDTATYFSSRWTASEYGRALAKGISILRVAWPGVAASNRTATAHSITLQSSDLTPENLLTSSALSDIQGKIEEMRSLSCAARWLNMHSSIEQSVKKLGGEITGAGLAHSVQVKLPGGTKWLLVPALGVPTAISMQLAEEVANGTKVAVIYDHVGLRASWQGHIEWLGERISTVQWLKASDLAWQLADLEDN